jgi:hypothetical protein
MPRKGKGQKTAAANVSSRWHPTIGKNPHVLDMKFESGIHKLVFLDLLPNRNLTFQQIRPRSQLESGAGGIPQQTSPSPVTDGVLAW